MNYPYVFGSYASKSSTNGVHTPLKCLLPLQCATTDVPASENAIWGVAAGTDYAWYDPVLMIDPVSVPCISFANVETLKNITKLNLSSAQVKYVCDGTPTRVFSCVGTDT